jgi:hypothetical protein
MFQFRVVCAAIGLFATASAYIMPAHALIIDETALTDAGEPGTDYIPFVTFNLDPPFPPDIATVTLIPGLPQGIAAFSKAALATYNNEKGAQFPDWNLALGSAADLHGVLTIDTYQARRGTAQHEGVGNAGGAFLAAHYTRAANDPTLSLTWLQFFTDNTGPGGSLVSHIDPNPNDDTKEKLPFYWRDNEAGEKLSDPFRDRPSDPITSDPFFRSVAFQLYLVGYNPLEVNDGTQGGTVTVYGGANWGYQIQVPEPNSAILFASMLVVLAFVVRVAKRGPV